MTGGAPIELHVLKFIKCVFCCPVLEGYGLTETAANGAGSNYHDPVPGHIGGPQCSMKFRLRDLPEMNYTQHDKPYPRGECCIKGTTVFSGYYKRPDKTAEAFDSEGWFLTGDVI